MSRAAHRRHKRPPSAASPTPTQLAVWHHGLRLPADHPLKALEPIPSPKERGFRCIAAAECAHPSTRTDPRLSNAHKVAIKAHLVCWLLTLHLQPPHRSADVVAVLYGLHPAVAEALGVVAANGVMRPVIEDMVIVLVETGSRSRTSLHDVREMGRVA